MKIGDYVQILGLQKAPQHNGSVGIIESQWTKDPSRWVVKKPRTGEMLSLKPVNICTTIPLPMLPSDQAPKCLGGAGEQYANEIIRQRVENSPYQRLLDRLPSKELRGPRHGMPIVDPILKEAYLKIYRGECDITYTQSQEPSKSYNAMMLVFSVSIPGQNGNKPVLSVCFGNMDASTMKELGKISPQFSAIATTVTAADVASGRTMSFAVCSCDKDFWGTTTLESVDDCLQEELQWRVLHLAMRNAGATLFGKEATDKITCYLCNEYGKRGWRKEDLDCAMVRADVLLSCCASVYDPIQMARCGHTLFRVAEILESMGRFVDAAQLYLYIPDAFYPGNAPELFGGLGNAALAYKRNGNFELAEKYYLLALQTEIKAKGDNFNMKNLFNITFMYWDCALSNSSDIPRIGQPCTDNIHAMNWIWNLLLGFAGAWDCIRFYDYDRCRAYIKSALWSQDSARNAIKTAILESSSSEEFRSKIMACSTLSKNKNKMSTNKKGKTKKDKKNGKDNTDDESFKFDMTDSLFLAYESSPEVTRQDAKEMAREERLKTVLGLQRGAKLTESEERCNNPTCSVLQEETDKKFALCPCHKVQYCGKACQMAHWKSQHKHDCPLSKKNRAKKQQQHEHEK